MMFDLPFEALALTWFVLLGVLLAGYAVLDGFDLGVGMVHPFAARNDHERRLVLNSIGPIWDGNEVWLVTFGGALFAAFPEAYATIFSGFYDALMLVLLGLITRAVSIEFRSKQTSPAWRHFWDWIFFGSSVLTTLVFGVAVGNAIRGVPLDERHDFTGTLLDLLNPYSLMTGLLAVTMFAMHGAIYLYLKTEGELQRRLVSLMWRAFGFFLVAFLLCTMFTLYDVPRATHIFDDHPWLWVVPVLNALAIANIPRAIFQGKPAYAFISSCCVIVAFVVLLTVALYPNLVTSSVNPDENSLSIYRAASSSKTLGIMLVIAVVGMPFVLTYTVVIYWTFRGKVKLDKHSY
jgi:cytochrome d ubiquinol oxidase subunit II